MTEVFQVGNKSIEAEKLIGILQRYQLLPQVMRGLVIDKAIAGYECTPEQCKDLREQFLAKHKLDTPEARAKWLHLQGLEESQLDDIATRPARLARLKQDKWGNKLESYFMTRKPFLDRVLYSLIRTKDLGTAQELYFRIQEGEQTFAEIAKQYSLGNESAMGGLVGPSPINAPHPAIARTLAVSQPGQLWPPTALEEWFIILRLEKFYPAQFDEHTRQQLLEELFENWIKEQIQEIRGLKTMAEVAKPS